MYLICKNTYVCLWCICVSRDAFWHLVHIHAQMPVCLSASAWKVMQLTLGVFLHHFHIGELISGAPIYPEIPFICIPSAKIAAKPAQFFTHLTVWVVVLILVENTLHWAIFPTLSLLMLPGFGQFLFVLGKERRKFQWTYWFPSDIKSLYQGYDLNI